MNQVASSTSRLAEFKTERLVRYDDLKPCTTAFIDTRTPGSAEKENFTIIGPGVAESPDQHVHIDIPHGFNIGGARQPPGCINSQHSHETAEVFVVHSGRWSFLLGPNKEDGEVLLGPGDTISIPIHVFRGFKNVGDDTGFLFAVLGGDDPGNVTWAPYVFDNAKEYGLVLLEDGSLVDTTRGETIPEGKKTIRPTTDEDVERFRRLSAAEMADCVVTRSELKPVPGSDLPKLREYPIIGTSSAGEGLPAGKIQWPHGFHVRHILVAPGDVTKQHMRDEAEVIMMHSGRLIVALPDGDIELRPGDVITIPVEMPRSFANRESEPAEAYVVRGGDQPKPATLIG
jgi:mannose-6-phosphate isomerase-like protein (cupin superfamily)